MISITLRPFENIRGYDVVSLNSGDFFCGVRRDLTTSHDFSRDSFIACAEKEKSDCVLSIN